MKNMKMIACTVDSYDLEGPVEDVIQRLRERSEGMVEPQLKHDYHGDYFIVGYRPMTEAEKIRARKASQAAKAAAAKRREEKEAKERAQYEKLKAKFG